MPCKLANACVNPNKPLLKLCFSLVCREMVLLQLHAHLNAVFAHFVEFHLRFHTLEEKELEV